MGYKNKYEIAILTQNCSNRFLSKDYSIDSLLPFFSNNEKKSIGNTLSVFFEQFVYSFYFYIILVDSQEIELCTDDDITTCVITA